MNFIIWNSICLRENRRKTNIFFRSHAATNEFAAVYNVYISNVMNELTNTPVARD